jgi:hypothetical protein
LAIEERKNEPGVPLEEVAKKLGFIKWKLSSKSPQKKKYFL